VAWGLCCYVGDLLHFDHNHTRLYGCKIYRMCGGLCLRPLYTCTTWSLGTATASFVCLPACPPARYVQDTRSRQFREMCCVALRCVVLRCVLSCRVVSCRRVVLRCIALCCVVSCRVVSCRVVSCCVALCCVVLLHFETKRAVIKSFRKKKQ
jgi:hypothetical protein